MPATCATCHTTGEIGQGLHELAEVGFGPDRESRSIHLCDDCLERRETQNWPLAAEAGKRIYEALHDKQQQAPSRRYSYLMEPEERLHLVRLRPDWVDRHAAEA